MDSLNGELNHIYYAFVKATAFKHAAYNVYERPQTESIQEPQETWVEENIYVDWLHIKRVGVEKTFCNHTT